MISTTHTEPLSRPRVLATAATLLALGLPSMLAPEVGQRVAGLFVRVDPNAPYFTGADPLYCYGFLPLVVASSLILVMAPGLLLAMGFSRPRTCERWLLYGFVYSVGLLGACSSLAQAVLPVELTGRVFVAFCSALTVLCGALACWRTPDRATAEALGMGSGLSRRFPHVGVGEVLSILAVPILFLVVLLPKFFWESFNGDGAHAFEATRLLLHQPLPFWEPDSGNAGAYPGMNALLYLVPGSWFMRLFGELEASVRLPYVLFMGLLFAAVVDSARQAREEPLSRKAVALVWASVVSFSLVMAYAATYDPYCADIALPATQDALLMAVFVAMTTSFLAREPAWIVAFTGCVLLCSPAGPVLIGGWFLAAVLCLRPLPVPRLVAYAAGAAGTVAVMAVAPDVLAALSLPAPGSEHAAGNLLKKFQHVLPNQLERFGWAFLPCGIYPAAALLMWRRADGGSRALLLVSLIVFAMYYLMAFVSLHYFVPAMVLPLVAFWRVQRTVDWRGKGPVFVTCAGLVLLSIALGLPKTPSIYTATREVGARIDASAIDGYDGMTADYFRSAQLLEQLFVPGWTPSVPEEHYAGGSLAWNYYAQRARRALRAPPPTYLLAPRGAEPPKSLPEAAELVAENEDAQLWAVDPTVWEAHRALRPLGSTWQRVYDVPRDILFGRPRAFERYTIFDIKDLLSR